MIDECTKVGLPEPEFNFDFNGLMVKFKGKPAENVGETSGERRENVGRTSGKRREKF